MKRVFDILIILIFSLVILLVCALVAILIKINLGSPVLFFQPRSGLNGNIFNMIKFRTMSNPINNFIEENQRLTKFGKFLRSTSLDELPELWNVLKGDMSLVGPRPLLVEYLPLYSKRQYRRHEAIPGITGWSQINGRNAITWEEKFELDIWYIDNKSFWLDIKILIVTIKKVILRHGISQNEHVTMGKFKGSL